MLWDVLVDFPVHALVAQTGLLRALLDVLGCTFTQMDIGKLRRPVDYLLKTDRCADSDPDGLNPLTVMRWFTKLLLRAAEAYSTQLTGSLCCTVPDLSHTFTKREGSWEGEGVQEEEENVDFSCRLARAMYAMRHPLLPAAAEEDEELQRQKALVDRDRGAVSLCPVPSLAGLAFACCAASFPLLRSRDVTTASALLPLLRAALPLVVEACALSGGEGPDKHTFKRLDHLLARTEEVSSDHAFSLCCADQHLCS